MKIIKLFQPRFAPMVKDGTKLNTIRPLPKRERDMPQVGWDISLREWSGKPYRSKQRVLKESVIEGVSICDVNYLNAWLDEVRQGRTGCRSLEFLSRGNHEFMKTKTDYESPALNFLQIGWDAIPRRSWRNRNAAMQGMVDIAISSGMEFHPDDFKEIYSRFNARYWIGQSYEGSYALACNAKSGANLSASIAWETYLGRPAVLWSERTRTPERLYVGAEFNWEGMRLTVTSMEKSHLIGCTYHRYKHEGERKIKNRVRVTYEAIQAVRKVFDTNRRKWEKEISAAKTHEELEAIGNRFAAGDKAQFRHFDVEMVRELYAKAGEAISANQRRQESEESWRKEMERRAKLAETHDADLALWISGEPIHRHFDVVRLRIIGDKVETSTGFIASVAAVKEALPFVKRYRKKGLHSNGTQKSVDEHPIKSVGSNGVQVGCTLVEWTEVDRIAELLK